MLFLAGHGLLVVVCLNLTAIAAYLFRSMVHTFRNSLRIRLIGVRERVLVLVRERVLVLGGAVANPLLRALAICRAICRADFAGGAEELLGLFVLMWGSARLTRVDE